MKRAVSLTGLFVMPFICCSSLAFAAYPYKCPDEADGVDKWNFYKCQCTSYAAYKITGDGLSDFSNYYLGTHWGNAGNWGAAAKSLGISVDKNPKVGDIAYWAPYGTGAMKYGHVAYVESVSSNNKVVKISEYNYSTQLQFGKRTIAVTNPSGYIHLNPNGPGGPTDPDDPPASGSLPDFITNKVIIGNEGGSQEKYTWKVNETAYVHSWTDNIGTKDWEGSAKKIKVPFYLSKGKKKDSSSEWVRVGREEIKKDHLDVKDKPKREKIIFNIPQWAAAGYIYPGQTYNFVVCADLPKDQDNGDGDVKEIHKSNNCSTPAVFYVDYGPARNVDLISNNLTLTGGKTALQAGESYGLQVELSNIGTESPWNGCRTSYEIKGPGTGGVWQKVIDEGSTLAQLAPNSTKVEVIDESRGLKAPSVGGDYVFRACADYEQAIPETDEGNNCTAELPITVTVPPPPPVNPYFVITNPTSGDDWRSSEDDHDVEWEHYDFPVPGDVKIEYSLDDGATWLTIADNTTNDGKKHWHDMCDFHTVDTHHAYVRITSLDYPGVVAVSEEFSIDHAAECK